MAAPPEDKFDRVLAFLEQVNSGLEQLRKDSNVLRSAIDHRLSEGLLDLQGRLDAMGTRVGSLEATVSAAVIGSAPAALNSPVDSCQSSFESS
jgi:hypothetical protein